MGTELQKGTGNPAIDKINNSSIFWVDFQLFFFHFYSLFFMRGTKSRKFPSSVEKCYSHISVASLSIPVIHKHTRTHRGRRGRRNPWKDLVLDLLHVRSSSSSWRKGGGGRGGDRGNNLSILRRFYTRVLYGLALRSLFTWVSLYSLKPSLTMTRVCIRPESIIVYYLTIGTILF